MPRSTRKLKMKYSTKWPDLRSAKCSHASVSSDAWGNRQWSNGMMMRQVACAERGRGDAHKAAAFLQLFQITDAAVAHAAAQPAHQLFHQRRQQPFIRHATFHTLRDGLPAVGGLLGIAVG